jgi:hypothetical protein
MNKCFTPNGEKLKCPRVILPIRNLAPNNINKSKAMRQAMKIRNTKSCQTCSSPNINLQRFQNEFNSSISGTISNNYTDNSNGGKICPYGLFYSYWLNKS